MAGKVQPAEKSYFFDKGYRDLKDVISSTWRNNGNTIRFFASRMGNPEKKSRFVAAIRTLGALAALISTAVFGSIVCFVLSILHILGLAVIMILVYIGFSLVWAIDRLYLLKNKIFTACHECKEKSLIPTYVCPSCGAKHTDLTPGVYGILHRKCTGISSAGCGQKLPTTFLTGRSKLPAECAFCSTPLNDRETVPICIPIVGGRSVGKTAFITAFSHDFIEYVAPQKGWEILPYSPAKEAIYSEIKSDYATGSTRMTARPTDRSKASSTSFSFFLHIPSTKPDRLIHVYDIAGEVFTDNNENEVQRQYEYCQGIVMVVDPFAIPSVRDKLEERLAPEDIAGIGEADINAVASTFLNKLRDVTGLSDKKMYRVPLAVVISKIDSAGLETSLGAMAVKATMNSDPEQYTNEPDTEDFLCRRFLKMAGMESFINNIVMRFHKNRFFACSAIGHTRDKGIYTPSGVMKPMEWLFGQADSRIASVWNDTVFKSRPLALKPKKEGALKCKMICAYKKMVAGFKKMICSLKKMIHGLKK